MHLPHIYLIGLMKSSTWCPLSTHSPYAHNSLPSTFCCWSSPAKDSHVAIPWPMWTSRSILETWCWQGMHICHCRKGSTFYLFISVLFIIYQLMQNDLVCKIVPSIMFNPYYAPSIIYIYLFFFLKPSHQGPLMSLVRFFMMGMSFWSSTNVWPGCLSGWSSRVGVRTIEGRWSNTGSIPDWGSWICEACNPRMVFKTQMPCTLTAKIIGWVASLHFGLGKQKKLKYSYDLLYTLWNSVSEFETRMQHNCTKHILRSLLVLDPLQNRCGQSHSASEIEALWHLLVCVRDRRTLSTNWGFSISTHFDAALSLPLNFSTSLVWRVMAQEAIHDSSMGLWMRME